jgi:hypothetical protein
MYKRITVENRGGSFHGVEVNAPIETLERLFGKSDCNSGDGKTKHEWVFRGKRDVIAVYDYKYDGARAGYWHVGGRDKIACLEFAQWLKKVIALDERGAAAREMEAFDASV